MAALEHDTVARPDELTPAFVWRAAAGSEVTDAVLEWPPDLFALTDVVLGRAEVFASPRWSQLGPRPVCRLGSRGRRGRRAAAPRPPARAGRSRPGRRESLRAPAHPSRQARAAIRFSAGLLAARLAPASRRQPAPRPHQAPPGSGPGRCTHAMGTAQDARLIEPSPRTNERQAP
jgi:hypothetical protein